MTMTTFTAPSTAYCQAFAFPAQIQPENQQYSGANSNQPPPKNKRTCVTTTFGVCPRSEPIMSRSYTLANQHRSLTSPTNQHGAINTLTNEHQDVGLDLTREYDHRPMSQSLHANYQPAPILSTFTQQPVLRSGRTSGVDFTDNYAARRQSYLAPDHSRPPSVNYNSTLPRRHRTPTTPTTVRKSHQQSAQSVYEMASIGNMQHRRSSRGKSVTRAVTPTIGDRRDQHISRSTLRGAKSELTIRQKSESNFGRSTHSVAGVAMAAQNALGQQTTELAESEVYQIRLMFSARNTNVKVCDCLANVYFTYRRGTKQPKKGDWELYATGVPVLLLESVPNTTTKKLSMIIAERGTGFTLYREVIQPMSNYQQLGRTFHTMVQTEDTQKLTGLSFDAQTPAMDYFQAVEKWSRETSDLVMNVQARSGKKGARTTNRRHSYSAATLRKTDISQPCCFNHVTSLRPDDITRRDGIEQQQRHQLQPTPTTVDHVPYDNRHSVSTASPTSSSNHSSTPSIVLKQQQELTSAYQNMRIGQPFQSAKQVQHSTFAKQPVVAGKQMSPAQSV